MTRRLSKIGFVIIALSALVNTASPAGPSASNLKELRLAHIDPPIKAPELRLMDLERREVSLGELRGKAVLLYFWASW